MVIVTKPIYLCSLWLLIIIFLFAPAYALSIRGQTLSPIIYEPGKIIANHYIIEGTSLATEVSLSGELSPYASISAIVNNQFDLTIIFPNETLSPGTHYFSLLINEIQNSAGGIGSTVSVSKVFTVEVYSGEKEIETGFSIPNININEPINFKLNVKSKSYQNIASVRGKIDLYNFNSNNFNNTPIASILTPEKPLPRLSAITLEGTYYSKDLLPGDYLAKATIFYDGKEKRVNSTFKIGSMNLKLLNYTSTFESEFSEFKAHVINNWGNKINNAYAQLIINDKVKLQTPTYSIGPWQELDLGGILKVDLPPGTYDGAIKLFFDGNEKEEKVALTIKKQINNVKINNAKINGATLIYVSYGMVIGIALISLLFTLRKIYREKTRKKDEI